MSGQVNSGSEHVTKPRGLPCRSGLAIWEPGQPDTEARSVRSSPAPQWRPGFRCRRCSSATGVSLASVTQAAALQTGMSWAPTQVLGGRAEARGRGRGLEPALSLRGHWGEGCSAGPPGRWHQGGGALRGLTAFFREEGVISRSRACEMVRAAFDVWLARQGAAVSDSSVSRDYGTVTIRSLFLPCHHRHSGFPWSCPSLEGVSLRAPYILPPCPACQCRRRSDTAGPFLPGVLSLPGEDDSAAEVHGTG